MQELGGYEKLFDILVKNGFIVDGSGNPWFRADVAIEDGKINKIGRISTSKADEVIDAGGLMVSPGFIDMHSHSDFFLLVNPRSESKIRQGVTTEVIGNCGFSMAPIYRKSVDFVKKELGVLANEITWDWSTFEEYRAKLLKQGISVNVAPLIGHGILRGNVMGYENREPTKDELDEMEALLAESMGAGAFGMSTGLIYTPGSYAKTEELIELTKVVSKYGGMYASHIRNESDRLLEAVKEAISIGEATGVPVEISHMKSAGRNNWGRIKEALNIAEAARDRGVEVTCDFYPYTAGSTGLDACLPPWAHEGGREEMFKRLQDEVTRKKIKDDIEKGVEGWENLIKNAGWDNVVIAYCEKNKQYEGLSISEIAKKQEADLFDAAFNLLLEEEGVVDIVLHEMWDEDMKAVMKHPLSMVGTDGAGYSPYGPLARGKPHPRNYGTFPRILGRYVREEKILMLQDAIRKMTSLPAEKLELFDRGLIREGFWADIVIFNPLKVTDKATFTNPHQYPEGIEYVIVNGQKVIDKKEHTGKLPGKVLRAKHV
jgi:N-acyl-D-amino-acid deacylase